MTKSQGERLHSKDGMTFMMNDTSQKSRSRSLLKQHTHHSRQIDDIRSSIMISRVCARVFVLAEQVFLQFSVYLHKWTEQKDIAAGHGSPRTVGGDHKENSHKHRHTLANTQPSRPVIGHRQHSTKTKDEPQRQNRALICVEWPDSFPDRNVRQYRIH